MLPAPEGPAGSGLAEPDPSGLDGPTVADATSPPRAGRVGPDEAVDHVQVVAVNQRGNGASVKVIEAAALERKTGVGEILEMTLDARLALPEHLRKLADRQLHQPQKHEDAQPSRIGERLEAVGKRKSGSHDLTI